jgi:hypothetical protein
MEIYDYRDDLYHWVHNELDKSMENIRFEKSKAKAYMSFWTNKMDSLLPPIDGNIAYKYFIENVKDKGKITSCRIYFELQHDGAMHPDNFAFAQALAWHLKGIDLKIKKRQNQKNGDGVSGEWIYTRLEHWDVDLSCAENLNYKEFLKEIKDRIVYIITEEIPKFEKEMEKMKQK